MKNIKDFLIESNINISGLQETLINILSKVDDEFDNSIVVNIDKVHITESFMSHIAGYIVENVVHNVLYTYKNELGIIDISDDIIQQKPYDFILNGEKIEIKSRLKGNNSTVATTEQINTKNEMIFCIITYSISGNKIIIDSDDIIVKRGVDLKVKNNSLYWK